MLIENLHLYWTENSQSQSQSQSIIKLEKERKETKTDIKRISLFESQHSSYLQRN